MGVGPLLGRSGRVATLFALPYTSALHATAAAAPAVEPRDEYRVDKDFFLYSRLPPAGFTRWLDYARPRECLLGRYDRLEDDLAPFRDPESPAKRTITRAALARAAALPHIVLFHVRRGSVSFDTAPKLASIAREYLVVLDRIAPYLPDTDFVLNTLDTPRVSPLARPICTLPVDSAFGPTCWTCHGYPSNLLRC